MTTPNDALSIFERPAPANIEAEQAVIGSMLLDNSTIADVAELLMPASFLRHAHQKLYCAIVELRESGKPVDPVILMDDLRRRGELEDLSDSPAGGLTCEYIAELFENTPTAANAVYYAKIVADCAAKRRIRDLGMRLVRDSANGEPADRVLLDATEDFERLRTDSGPRPNAEYYSIRALIDQYPRLHPPIIDGLLRERETLNIISVSKIGKSWLLYSLLLCIVTGIKWLGRFATKRGRVLLIDNELHKPTIANRIKTVAESMAIPVDDYLDSIDVWPLRGALQDIFSIGRELEKIEGQYVFIGLDAKYRAIPPGKTEHDNAAETHFYNEVDRLGDIMGSAIGMVHHSSKGAQGEKRITDVGAGAGAQSRAADAHLILREHEEADAVVLDAAVRSFKPVEPMGLRWTFPLWIPAEDLDTDRLKGRLTRADEKQSKLDDEADAAVLSACDDWRTRNEVVESTGFGRGRVNRAIARLRTAGELRDDKQNRPRNPKMEVFKQCQK